MTENRTVLPNCPMCGATAQEQRNSQVERIKAAIQQPAEQLNDEPLKGDALYDAVAKENEQQALLALAMGRELGQPWDQWIEPAAVAVKFFRRREQAEDAPRIDLWDDESHTARLRGPQAVCDACGSRHAALPAISRADIGRYLQKRREHTRTMTQEDRNLWDNNAGHRASRIEYEAQCFMDAGFMVDGAHRIGIEV